MLPFVISWFLLLSVWLLLFPLSDFSTGPAKKKPHLSWVISVRTSPSGLPRKSCDTCSFPLGPWSPSSLGTVGMEQNKSIALLAASQLPSHRGAAFANLMPIRCFGLQLQCDFVDLGWWEFLSKTSGGHQLDVKSSVCSLRLLMSLQVSSPYHWGTGPT